MSGEETEVAAEEPEKTLEEAPPVREWTDEDEEKAAFIGWRKVDDPAKRPRGYIEDPRRYIERAESILPYKKLKEQFENREKQREMEMEALRSGLERVHEGIRKREIDRLKAEMREAARFADEERHAKAVEAYERAVQTDPAAVPKPQTPQIAPEEAALAQKWLRDNGDWYNSDAEARKLAEDAFAESLTELRNTAMANRLAYVDRMVRAYKSAKSRAAEIVAAKPAAAKVDPGGLPRSGRKEAFDDLPKTCHEQFARDVKAGLFENDADGREMWRKLYTGEI